jgi:hypothetical protein
MAWLQKRGGVYVEDGDVILTGCTVSDNTADAPWYYAYGGGFYCDSFTSNTTMTNTIIWGNSAVSDGNQLYNNAGTPIDLDCCCYSDDAGDIFGSINPIDEINDNPLFVAGYYLSQIAAGQAVNSLCLDAGTDTAANLGMDTKTTRTDEVTDTGDVDIGYHYEP